MNDTVKEKNTYRILEDGLQDLTNFIEKMNKRAKKLGFPLLSFSVLGESFEKIKFKTGEEVVVKFLLVEIDGIIPIINGYRFVAKLEHLSSGNIIKKDNSMDLPSFFQTAPSNCDHCHTKHSRKYTYVIQNINSNKYLQIGTSCIDDYLGCTNINYYISSINSLLDKLATMADDEIYLCKCKNEKYFNTETFLAHVCRAVEVFNGFKTKAMCEYDDKPTFYHANFSIKNFVEKPELYQNLQPTNLSFKKAKEIKEKVLDHFSKIENRSEYQHNLFTLLNEEYVSVKNTPLLASAYLAYTHIIEYEQKEHVVLLNEYYGDIGTKVELELKPIKIVTISSCFYDDSYLYIFLDKDNRTFIWKSSKFKEELDVEKNLFFKLKGTIKEHSEYNGTKQTVLTRCKIL